MIYGAYGYTGKLIAKEAVLRGLRPILAGRNGKKVKALADRLNLDFRCFDLKAPENIHLHLHQINALLNCAGPFTATSVPLAKACIKTGCNYLDITGEIEVFEYLYNLDDKAVKTGMVLCPGAGFDVIATDCMAAALKAALPGAEYLSLAFHSESPLSPGTLKTIIEGIKNKGMIRKKGVIKSVPFAFKVRNIDFGDGPRAAVTIPWGDVSTAYYTTGIPHIEVYGTFPEKWIAILKILRIFRPIIGLELVQKFLKKTVEMQVSGPTAEHRETAPVYLWGEVRDSKGSCFQAHLTTGNGYDVTKMGSLGIVEKVLNQSTEPGFYTPSQLMGAHYISRLSGCGPIKIFTPKMH